MPPIPRLTEPDNADNHNRVWIKQSAIEDALKQQKQQSKKAISSSEFSSNSSNSSSTATPPARNSRNSLPNSKVQSFTNSSFYSAGNNSFSNHSFSNHSNHSSFSSFVDKSPYSRKSFVAASGRSDSINAVILPTSMFSAGGSTGTTQETETSSFCTESSNQSCRQAMSWGWKSGYLIENSGGHVLVQLANVESTGIWNDTSTISLPADAITVGDVVLSNDYYVDPDTGMPQAPHDLITLTHLHEPAVIESLKHRYAADQIYTNTGPVLLALNPFQTVRGLYGESVQKKYWEKAERNLRQELPPHVYAIADEAFRSMVRALEDTTTKSVLTAANQSILVSGESGAGKTVTTKFVMKYLAALSHRSTALQKSSEQRAYQKAQDVNIRDTTSPYASPKFGKGTFPYAGFPGIESASSTKLKSSNTRNSVSSPTNETTVTNMFASAGGIDGNNNSIEAQVLQSNPILESFGNARTVRNDNSSRFGKFIEIQFTQGGKLVGAQIETYLLEKVRLVTQTPGERNYHIFYEILSGAIDRRELCHYFLAHTAAPEDFKITACSGTYDRRDGVSDRETYALLRQAMKTMNFSSEDITNVFKITAAIMHASNLTFVDIPGTSEEECQLDSRNIHLEPVCLLLGVSFEALNQALCTYTIQAGKNAAITRALNKSKAATGLDSLLKETYGALFNYLVRYVNASIAYKDDQISEKENTDTNRELHNLSIETTLPLHCKPAASVGVLDIFGFESFTKNSFEQLCINYCNEALQQQFNAFVLRNEQAEYEAEGIEWSFIEFPENQDAIDLIDSNIGILRILDDQCRAPGPSDRAFAVNIYQQCSGSSRFIASRKQQATLKFSVLHYAGPVEYTSDGFTEKNRDELPKESTELLLQSEVPLVRELAKIMSESPEAPNSSGGTPTSTPSKMRLHRVDSSVGRPTVGGQFRRQLKVLRSKIDLTSPHYIRCLKPNDHLVPDHFDTAVVAEQLRCGGILEAVRVARAGFTQHYPHADFIRRYRTLAWRELASGSSSKTSWSGTAPRTPVGGAIGHTRNFKNSKRHSTGSFGANPSSFLPSAQNKNVANTRHSTHTVKLQIQVKPPQEEMTAAEAKVLCQDLIKILYRKIQQQEQDDADILASNDSALSNDSSNVVEQPPVVPALVLSSSTTSPKSAQKSYAAPSWSLRSPSTTPIMPPKSPLIDNSPVYKPKLAFSSLSLSVASPSTNRLPPSGSTQKSKLSPWDCNADNRKVIQANTSPQPQAWRKRVSTVSTSDYGRVGIQMGKTKVFLRHKAFEALERIRSTEQNTAATRLNSIFRRYLARVAYIPYRDAFRQELKDRRRMFEHASAHKESKDDFDDDDDFLLNSRGRGFGSYDRHSFSGVGSAIPMSMFAHSSFHSESLVDKWAESKIRDAIRNPVPRSQWGKVAPAQEQSFKWVISDDGLWVKNYSFVVGNAE